MTCCPKYADARARFARVGAPISPDDGFPVWPGPALLTGTAKAGSFDNTGATGLLRANGFASTWTAVTNGGAVFGPGLVGAIGPLIAAPIGGADPLFPLIVTCNSGASDGGVDSYTWYLFQRSDGLRYVRADGTLSPTGQPQYFSIAHPDATHSGTVLISIQSPQIAALFPGSGGVPPTDAVSLATLFADCALYVSRNSDRAYQHARFVAAT